MTSQLKKRHRRSNAQIKAVREAAREELAAGHPMTLRQVHYRLVSREDIVHPNKVSAYNRLSKWLRDDRLDGITPWEWMEDRIRQATRWAAWQNPKDFLHEERFRYSRDAWQDQPNYLEVWCEKDALSSIFESVLSRYQVVLNIGRGYDGWSSIKEAADRLEAHEVEGKDVTVLYFGDFDPSGGDMHRSLRDRFAMLDVYPDMPKIALTYEDSLVLPGEIAKADDSRAPAFIAKYGSKAVELDALPVDELRARIRSEVEARMDMDALAESRRIEREEEKDLRERIDRMFDDNEEV